MSGPSMDLLALTAELVDMPSVSHNESGIADHVESLLSSCPHLETRRLGNNICSRTSLGRPMRMLLAGHLDTVPANGNERAEIRDNTCYGLGSADMKGGLAAMIELMRRVSDPAVDLTFIAYVCEEVDQKFSGLGEIERGAPDWLVADVAIHGEPTGSVVEAGCQGVLRIDIELRGTRAHTARPWAGVNAIHRLAPALERVAAFEERRPVIDGCEFREALQVVSVEGGVANNVVPDSARLVVNHRFAPDRSVDEAYRAVADLLEPALDPRAGDTITLTNSALAAAPGLSHPALARLVQLSQSAPRAKLGWTDVSFFTARGVPAANFGSGDPTLAHTAGECVTRSDLDKVYGVLHSLVTA